MSDPKKLEEAFNELDRLLEVAHRISRAASGSKVDAHIATAGAAFLKLTLHGTSVKAILPALRREALWDIPSVAALARCAIESYEVLRDVGVEPKTLATAEFRLLCRRLHGTHRLAELYEHLGASKPSIEAAVRKREQTEKALQANADFHALDAKGRDTALRKPPVLSESSQAINERAGVSLRFHRFALKYLSQHVHGFDLSLDFLEDARAGDRAAASVLLYAVLIVNTYLALAIRDLIELMPAHRPQADAVKDLIAAYQEMARRSRRRSNRPGFDDDLRLASTADHSKLRHT